MIEVCSLNRCEHVEHFTDELVVNARGIKRSTHMRDIPFSVLIIPVEACVILWRQGRSMDKQSRGRVKPGGSYLPVPENQKISLSSAKRRRTQS